MATLLNLPGEIRNHIYRYTLVSAKPFTVKLQFFPRDTALFRVNRQVYVEASTIFYHENVFHFPQSLFDGDPVLEKLEYFIRLPRWRLATLKNFKLDFPVRSPIIKLVHQSKTELSAASKWEHELVIARSRSRDST